MDMSKEIKRTVKLKDNYTVKIEYNPKSGQLYIRVTDNKSNTEYFIGISDYEVFKGLYTALDNLHAYIKKSTNGKDKISAWKGIFMLDNEEITYLPEERKITITNPKTKEVKELEI